jgi:hypothetical protein
VKLSEEQGILADRRGFASKVLRAAVRLVLGMTWVITVTNKKGGVGKTTSVIRLISWVSVYCCLSLSSVLVY